MKEQPQNILVVLPRPLGDAVMAAPALVKLRQAFASAKICVFGSESACAVLEHHPAVDVRIPAVVDRKGRLAFVGGVNRLCQDNFDAVLLLNNSFRSALMVRLAGINNSVGYQREGRGVLLSYGIKPFRLVTEFVPMSMATYYLRLVHHAIRRWGGATSNITTSESGQLYISPDDEAQMNQVLQRWGVGTEERLIMLVPGGAFGPSKYWPPDRWAQLADKLSESKPCRILLCCSPDAEEQRIAQVIQSQANAQVFNLGVEKIPLGALKAFVQKCAVMIANDTGPVHIAKALGTPVVTLFGPTDPRWTASSFAREIRLHHPEACPPCQKPNCARDHACMKAITVEDVFIAARQLLNNETVPRQTPFSPAAPYRVFEESFIPLNDDTGLMHEGYQAALAAAGLDTSEGVFIYQAGKRLEKPGLGSRERIRLELDVHGRRIGVYLKRFGRPNWSDWLKRLLTDRGISPTAMFDFAGAMHLAMAGVAVPRPIAVASQSGGLREKCSFVMLEELPAADALERLLPRWNQAAQTYILLRHPKELVSQAGSLVRRLHASGYVHRDLYLSHLFLSRDAAGLERLVLIDLQRVFRPRWRMRRWVVKDLAQLYYSSKDYVSQSLMVRFARRYFGGGKLTPAQKALLRAAIGKAQSIQRRQQRKQQRNKQR